MKVRRATACATGVLAVVLLGSHHARAQGLVLTKDCELGFQQLIHAAQSSELGSDVSNANVGIEPSSVRVELVAAGGANRVLFLRRRQSASGLSQYFDIDLGAGATAADAARVGAVLDRIFREDPFEVGFDFFGAHSGEPLPTLVEAWTYGGWRRVVRVLERRFTAPVGVRQAAAIIAAVALVGLASVVVLWFSKP